MSDTDIRIQNWLLILGVVASLVLAFPLMIGMVDGPLGLSGGYGLLFPVPVIACWLLGRAIVGIRRIVRHRRV